MKGSGRPVQHDGRIESTPITRKHNLESLTGGGMVFSVNGRTEVHRSILPEKQGRGVAQKRKCLAYKMN